MKIDDFLSPAELKRLVSALLVVLGFIAIAAFFGFTVVPGLRYQAHDSGENIVQPVQGESGWLDPTDYPAQTREVIPPIDPKTVMTPNPALMARGKALFAQTCATCHGPEGKGDGPGGVGLNPKPRNFTASVGWKNGTRLEDIYKTLDQDLVHVVQSLGTFDHGANDPKAIASLEKLFASAGEVIPNRIPVSRAVDILCREYAEAHPQAAPTGR